MIKPISQADVIAYNDAIKTKQADTELGSDVIRIIIETIVPIIQDGSINTKTPADIIIAAKEKRKAEL